MLGCRFDDLRRREQERQFRRLALLTTAALVGLVVVASLGLEALRQKSIADQQTAEALAQKKLAEDAATRATKNQSIALTALADTQATSRPVNAAKLALAAWPRDGGDARTPGFRRRWTSWAGSSPTFESGSRSRT